MSRIGKIPVTVPGGVDVSIDGQDVTVKGPKGSLALTISEPIAIAKNDDGTLSVTRPDDERRSRALHGLSRTLVQNLITGVTDGYTTKMEIHASVTASLSRAKTSSSHSATATRFRSSSGRHHLRGRVAHQVLGVGHRQAEGRADLGQHPSSPSSGPVQGQGRALRG